MGFKVEVADFRKYVDYLKLTNSTSLFEAVDDVGALKTVEIPIPSTRDVRRDGTTPDELEEDTNDEQIAVR